MLWRLDQQQYLIIEQANVYPSRKVFLMCLMEAKAQGNFQ